MSLSMLFWHAGVRALLPCRRELERLALIVVLSRGVVYAACSHGCFGCMYVTRTLTSPSFASHPARNSQLPFRAQNDLKDLGFPKGPRIKLLHEVQNLNFPARA